MQEWFLLAFFFFFCTKYPFTIGIKNKILTSKLNKNGYFIRNCKTLLKDMKRDLKNRGTLHDPGRKN